MKASELIEFIKENKVEDYDIEFVFTDGYSTFPNIRNFKIREINDVGHSDKVVSITGEES